uniref:Ovule protein n=1 Tax=Heterorhabditis bacteriophora TaxID=37862 RepID=A0A1I7WDK3_HETBA
MISSGGRGNSSSTSVNRHCSRSWILVTYFDSPLALIIVVTILLVFCWWLRLLQWLAMLKTSVCLNARSWNNKRGLRFYLLVQELN